MKFTKMHGAGNDYIYVDCFTESIPNQVAELARVMSDRRRGVGADGLILICPSKLADAEMRMFNADGTPAEMCGNGIRCVAKYVYDHQIVTKEQLRIASHDNIYDLHLIARDGMVEQVRVDMGEPILAPNMIPTTLASSSSPAHHQQPPIINHAWTVGGNSIEVTCLSMGNPHCVIFVDNLAESKVHELGPLIENDPHFPQRTNVEFVERLHANAVRQRTWERGSGETQACGTGASAVCVAGVLSGRTQRQITVHLLGGDLQLEWNESNNHVTMTGPAVEVFSGQWSI